MSITQDFLTRAMYPGGQTRWNETNGEWEKGLHRNNAIYMQSVGMPIEKGCKVGTDDRFPDHPWKVNISLVDFHKYTWNLEDWETSLHVACAFDDSDATATPPVPEKMDYDGTVKGKFHAAWSSSGGGFITEGAVLKGEPKDQICGDVWISRMEEGVRTDDEGDMEVLLPCVDWFDSFESGPYSDSEDYNIQDDEANAVGNVNSSVSESAHGSYVAASFHFFYARLLGDGTVDLYFQASFWAIEEYEAYYDWTMHWADTHEDYDETNGPYYGWTVYPRTITVLGQSVDVYLFASGGQDSAAPNLDSFTFDFDISVTTAFTY